MKKTVYLSLLSLPIFFIGIFQSLSCNVVQKNSLAGQISESNSLQNNINAKEIENNKNKALQSNANEKKVENKLYIDLEKNRQLWQESKIIDYKLTIWGTRGGNVPNSTVLIEVRNGKGTRIDGTNLVDKRMIEIYQDLDTVEKVFDVIERELANGKRVAVKYNKKLGYPEDLIVSEIGMGIDAWYRIIVKKFEPIISN